MAGGGVRRILVWRVRRVHGRVSRGGRRARLAGRGSALDTAAPETKDAASTAGVDASALSFVSLRGSALVSGRSFHRDRFAPVCRVSWRGRWGEPRVDRFCRIVGGSPSVGLRPKWPRCTCGLCHFPRSPAGVRSLFFSLHLIAARSAPAVPNEGRVFHPFSGRLIFRLLGVVVPFFNASSPNSSWGKFSYV